MRRSIRRAMAVAVALCIGPLGILATTPAAATTIVQGRVVSAVPASWTPHVNDGQVLAIAQVGDRVVLGGTFTSVSPTSGYPNLPRSGLFAFDATTGTIDAGFAPTLNGIVDQVAPGPLPGTVLASGTFSTVNGQTVRNIVLLNLSDGSRNTSFSPPLFNGEVKDMKRVGDRLMVGGTFTAIGGVPHAGIASLDFASGALDPFVNLQMAGHHNWYEGCNGCSEAGVGVWALDATPDGKTLIAIGNFTQVDGLDRDQIVDIDLSGTTATVRADWNTDRYTPPCSWRSFDTYMRDIDMSPDGSYFVVVTTGAGYNGTLCDSTARFETAQRGDDIQPTWVDAAGGDTFLSVAVTDKAVYVGGHQRWVNNEGGRDSAVAGAVPRPGLAALDPTGGVPLTWNPGRQPRGVGASALLVTDAGLWVGSDTAFIGPDQQYFRPRIAFFPLAGGAVPPADTTPSLPATVFLGGPLSSGLNTLSRRTFDGSAAPSGTMDTAVTGSPLDWREVRGAVQVGDTLFYGRAGMLYRAPFNGTTIGASTAVDPYRDPLWCPIPTGSGSTKYCGVLPTFYGELSNVTAMAYADGRLYYTLAGSSSLQYRWFSPESGVVSPKSYPVAGSLPAGSPVLMIVGSQLYFADRSTGTLSRIGLSATGLTGSAVQVSGPAIDGRDWRARAVFLAAHLAEPVPPVAGARAPSKPALTKVKVTKHHRLALRWSAAQSRGAPVTGYTVQVKPRKKHSDHWKKWRSITQTPPRTLRYTWKRAKAATTYKVRVVAHSAAGSTHSTVRKVRA